MERILKILGIAAIIFLLIYWISDISKGCNGSKDNENTEELIQIDNQGTGDSEVDMEEDIFGEEQAKSDNTKSGNQKEESSSSTKEDVDDYVDYSGEVKESKKQKETVIKKAAPNKSSTTKRHKASTGGKYLVVAGSYLVKANANKMKQKLYNLGYNSEIVNFDLSQYYSVLAGRFSSRKEANEAVTILKRSGIDCYVHRKK